MPEKTVIKTTKKILIVEDEELNFMLLEIYLSKKNFQIFQASNGLDAIKMFQKNRDIDLILMDLRMPVMDGFQAIRQIRELDKEIPIIAQTAYSMPQDNKKAFEAGCTDYIEKPIKKENLLALIDKYLK